MTQDTEKLELSLMMKRDDLLASLTPKGIYEDGLDECYYKWADFWHQNKRPVNPETGEYLKNQDGQLCFFV